MGLQLDLIYSKFIRDIAIIQVDAGSSMEHYSMPRGNKTYITVENTPRKNIVPKGGTVRVLFSVLFALVSQDIGKAARFVVFFDNLRITKVHLIIYRTLPW